MQGEDVTISDITASAVVADILAEVMKISTELEEEVDFGGDEDEQHEDDHSALPATAPAVEGDGQVKQEPGEQDQPDQATPKAPEGAEERPTPADEPRPFQPPMTDDEVEKLKADLLAQIRKWQKVMKKLSLTNLRKSSQHQDLWLHLVQREKNNFNRRKK